MAREGTQHSAIVELSLSVQPEAYAPLHSVALRSSCHCHSGRPQPCTHGLPQPSSPSWINHGQAGATRSRVQAPPAAGTLLPVALVAKRLQHVPLPLLNLRHARTMDHPPTCIGPQHVRAVCRSTECVGAGRPSAVGARTPRQSGRCAVPRSLAGANWGPCQITCAPLLPAKPLAARMPGCCLPPATTPTCSYSPVTQLSSRFPTAAPQLPADTSTSAPPPRWRRSTPLRRSPRSPTMRRSALRGAMQTR
jgi:hypothetical protein